MLLQSNLTWYKGVWNLKKGLVLSFLSAFTDFKNFKAFIIFIWGVLSDESLRIIE